MSNTKKVTILIVDDTPNNLDLLGGVLREEYRVKTALRGDVALKIARSEPQPDMIILDIMMPDMDGYEVCKQLKSDPKTAHIPVIFITAKNEVEDEKKGLEIGAVDYIIKPINPPLVITRVAAHLSLYNQRRDLENLVSKRTKEIDETRLAIIQRLGRAAEYKDNETGLHVIRMSYYAKLIAEQMNMPSHWCELIFNASPMHDVGKIGIPDRIILKPGKLDKEEWEIMQKHPEFGAEIIGQLDSELLKFSYEIAISHHEKWNGKGYPNGLTKEEIPIGGRIVAVADVFDALTSERPYKKAWPVEKAIDLIQSESGEHFDPQVVEAFNQVIDQCLEIKNKFAEN